MLFSLALERCQVVHPGTHVIAKGRLEKFDESAQVRFSIEISSTLQEERQSKVRAVVIGFKEVHLVDEHLLRDSIKTLETICLKGSLDQHRLLSI